MSALEVLATGPLATVQDLGRSGYARWGVSPSGAADRGALRLANRLVGNTEAEAGIEVTLGGLRVRADGPVLAAVTGAACPVTVGGRPVGRNAPLTVPDDAELLLGTATAGLRTYLAVRGGIDIASVLGSRSTDVLSGLGPHRLQPGGRLPLAAADPARQPSLDLAPVADPPAGEVAVRARLGPREDWFTEEARTRLAGTSWSVTADSDRVGVRLDGPVLQRTVPDELPTEGMVRGAVQVPPSGRPTILLADHPVTGGYPVVAVILDADVDRVAQLRPGQALRFTLIR